MDRGWLVVAFLFAATSAHAAQCGGDGPQLKDPALCTKLFTFSGTCGRPNYPYPGWPDIALAVGAWEPVPIRVLSVSADAMVTSRWWRLATASIFSGNSFNADPMTPYRNGVAAAFDIFGRSAVAVHSEGNFPGGAGMQFPAGQPMPRAHLDVHLSCTPLSARYSGSLWVSYVLDVAVKNETNGSP